MAKPGVVLKRPVGSDGPFGEHSELPMNLGQDGQKKSAHKPCQGEKSSAQPDKAADRQAAQAYERERQRREREEAKEEATRQRERARRQEAIERAQAALDTAEQKHAQRVAELRVQIEAIEKNGRSRGHELGCGSEAVEGGRAAGTELRSAAQECVNQLRFLAKNKFYRPLETFSRIPNSFGVAIVAIGMPSRSRHLRRAPEVSGAARNHFAPRRIWLCAL